jgi:hypothetical protein
MPETEVLELFELEEIRRSSDGAGALGRSEVTGSGVVAGVSSWMVLCSTVGNVVYGRDDGEWGGECGCGDWALYCDAGASLMDAATASVCVEGDGATGRSGQRRDNVGRGLSIECPRRGRTVLSAELTSRYG